jgi:hypothetical protein
LDVAFCSSITIFAVQTTHSHVRRIVTACLCFFLVTGWAGAQSLEKRALRNLSKAKWQKAEDLLTKASTRDSLNAVADFAWAQFYFSAENPAYNLDSAYRYTSRSLLDIAKMSPRQREKISRFPIDSISIVKVREAIDSVAFSVARSSNTEEAYIKFLARHPYSTDRETSIQLRNAVAFLDAVNLNTYTAFKTFLEKYPSATEVTDAKARYERLLFEEKTRDRRLASFESFLKDYPETPFRREIEKDIFELYTLSGEVERYIAYIKLYPGSSYEKRASNILFHILYDSEDIRPSGLILTDSLEKILAVNQGYLVPFLKRDKFGFMNNQGFEVIPPSLENLPEQYSCGNISDDVLVLADRVISRNGFVIYRGETTSVEDLGTGFLRIQTDDCIRVIHKSGFELDSCVLDVKMIDKRFVAVRSEKGWTVKSLTGRPVLSELWDEINPLGNVIGLVKDKNTVLLSYKQLADLAHEQEFTASNVVTEVKLLDGGMLWVSANGNQGIFDQNMKEIVPLNDHKIQTCFAGFIIQSAEGFSIYDALGHRSSFFDRIVANEPFIKVRKNHLDYLFDVEDQKFASRGYDSISFEGSFMKGVMSDSIFVYFQNQPVRFSSTIKTRFISGKDSASYLSIEQDGKRTLYDQEGAVLFTVPLNAFENIQHAGSDLFIVSKKDKKGLIDNHGKMVLAMEYDAIGTSNQETISLLRASKFGLLNTRTRKLIKPQYDKNILNYKKNLLIAFRDGSQAFIDWENKAQSKFEFEEIKYWNDSIALMKKNKVWEMLDLSSGKIVLADVRGIVPIRETPDEKLFIMNQNNLFGVVSSTRGKIIPFSFSDLVNVGSADEPLYFTEKHVSEASVFVVIYYDKNGKMLRREVYEESEDYEKIYCQQN